MRRLARTLAALAASLSPMGLPAAGAPELLRIDRVPTEAYAGHPQNWGGTHDQAGILFIANGEGLLVYDGARFRKLGLPNQQLARSVARGADGLFYVGGLGELAVLGTGAEGEWRLDSITAQLPAGRGPIGYVWDIQATATDTWMRIDDGLLRIAADTGAAEWELNQGAHALAISREGVQSLIEGRGWCQWREARFDCRTGTAALARSGARLFADVRDGLTLYAPPEGGLWSLSTPPDQPPAVWLAADVAGRVLAVRQLADGRRAVGSATRGLLLLDPQGGLLGQFERQDGYPLEPILGMFEVPDGSLWLTLDRGLARVRLDQPLQRFDATLGVPDRPSEMIEWQGGRWLGTSRGLRRWVDDHWEAAGPWEGDVVDLAVVDDALWVLSSSDGLLRWALPPQPVETPVPAPQVVDLMVSTHWPGRVYIGTLQGVRVMQVEGARWRERMRLPGPAVDTRMLIEDDQGALWGAEVGRGVRRWRFDAQGESLDSSAYTSAEGLPESALATLFAWRGEVRIGVPGGSYGFDPAGRLVVDPATSAGRPEESLRVFKLAVVDERTAVALVDGPEGPGWFEHWDYSTGRLDRHRLEFPELQHRYAIGAHADPRPGLAWLIAADGAYALRLDRVDRTPAPATLLYSSLVLGGVEQPVRRPGAPAWVGTTKVHSPGSALQDISVAGAIPAASASLTATLAQAGSLPVDGARFLVGYGDEGGAQTIDPVWQLDRLRDGDHHASVQAAGRPAAAPLRLSFRVDPPWHRSAVALVVYGLLAIVSGLGLWKLARRQQRRRLAQLEALVRQRTLSLDQRANELRRERDTLDRMAHSDALTGLGNRRHLESRLPLELARVQRRGSSLSIVMIDIDHFKLINDQYGHPVGDTVLATVAGLLKCSCRPYDEAFRYGGEEILIVMPETRLDEAYLGSERLRQAVESHRWREHPALRATASFGLAQALPGDSPQRLLARADAALYLAKRLGRNRVERAPEPDIQTQGA